ncbi:MAG: DUF1249 domain-containing protein [Synechococcaceae cyanobacterium SM1_2_3]|nr:DUF1249 domain-containing protein [Synechococcaceae cyanobacterium SM1_2_3]
MILLHPTHAHLIQHDTPGAFAALMDLYERNYINLRRLLPTMPAAQTAAISQVPGGLDLHLRIIERCRYTSELILTYQFDQGDGGIASEPNLCIRVYHDARLAEVLAAYPRRHPSFHAPANGRLTSSAALLTRWQMNRFLFKWLSYCLRQGHCFAG